MRCCRKLPLRLEEPCSPFTTPAITKHKSERPLQQQQHRTVDGTVNNTTAKTTTKTRQIEPQQQSSYQREQSRNLSHQTSNITALSKRAPIRAFHRNTSTPGPPSKRASLRDLPRQLLYRTHLGGLPGADGGDGREEADELHGVVLSAEIHVHPSSHGLRKGGKSTKHCIASTFSLRFCAGRGQEV